MAANATLFTVPAFRRSNPDVVADQCAPYEQIAFRMQRNVLLKFTMNALANFFLELSDC
jgi:hypothetical protein